MFKLIYGTAEKLVKSKRGAIYILKLISIISIAQIVGSVFVIEQNYSWGSELFCSGCATGILGIGFYLFLDKLKQNSAK